MGLLLSLSGWQQKAPPTSAAKSANSAPQGVQVSGTWRPSWETVPDRSKSPKQQLAPTVTFVDDYLGFIPILGSDEEKQLHEKELSNRDLFFKTFRRVRECKNVTFMLTHPKHADFDLQLFGGIGGRTEKWQWVLYRTDITERLAF